MVISEIDMVLSAVPDPMLFLSESGDIVACNAAGTGIWGDWIIGRSYGTVLRQPGLLTQIEAVRTGAPAIETRLQRSDATGETRFQVRIAPFGGETTLLPRALLLHFRDVTHLHEAEDMRRDFVANVSHELRTPLTAVLGFIETLQGPARNDTAARDRFLAIMEQEARRMNRLVEDLLSLSRVEGVERLRPSSEVDLLDVLNAVIATLRPKAMEADCEISLETEEPAADLLVDGARGYRVLGDRDQLMQVFFNLTENALKYGRGQGGIRLRLLWQEGTGTLRGPVVRVEVIDHGIGIDPLHLPRLTERFYRIDAHRSREMGGTGLGLAIVKHIVNRHRGRLSIQSKPGEGSTFSVLLPAN